MAIISNILWNIAIPVLVVASLYLIVIYFVNYKKLKVLGKIEWNKIYAPTVISMGTMIGCGSIVGILAAISTIVTGGQIYFEAIVFWFIIGLLIFLPLSFFETMVSKKLKLNPREYITKYVSKRLALFYGVTIIILYCFAFAGYQYIGIAASITVFSEYLLDTKLSNLSIFIYIVVPITVIIYLIIRTKKHALFVNSLGFIIIGATILYTILLYVFLFATLDYLPIFLERMILGITQPVNAFIGVPMALIIAWQRIVQVAENGLGTKAMVALENDMNETSTAFVAIVPTIFSLANAIIGTTYIASYGVSHNTVIMPATSFDRLFGFFDTIASVVGPIGIIIVAIFLISSGFTTILGSYYYLTNLYGDSNKVNGIYYVLIIVASVLAIFGGESIFDAVDLFMVVLLMINVITLVVIIRKLAKA